MQRVLLARTVQLRARPHTISSNWYSKIFQFARRSMASQGMPSWISDFDKRHHSAANDFRSDTVTLPSGAMLSSILSEAASFGDDVFSEDEPTNKLEALIGELTGMGHAVFVMSGTMGNQLAIRSLLTQPPYSVVLDRRSHIFEYECGMASMFSQAHLIPVMPDVEKQAYLALDDIVPNIVPDDGDTHGAPTRLIALENTFWGKIMPLTEVKKIYAYAQERGIRVHMDGARLWNACYSNASESMSAQEAAEAAKSLLKEYCAHFDTVSLCFSKSLGAPSGSVLLSKHPEVIAKARHFRKALGGGMRQIGVLTAPARIALEEVFLSGVPLRRANAMAKDLEASWKNMGGEIQPGLAQETNMVWVDLKKARVKDEEFVRIAEEEGVKVFDGRIVAHYQIALEAIEALKRAFKRTLELGKTRGSDPAPERTTGSHSYRVGNVPGE